MTLISLLLVLILETFFRISAILEEVLKYHNWFPNWYKWIRTRIKQKWFDDWPGIILILAVPVGFIHLLYTANNGFLFLLFQLVLSVLVLTYAICIILYLLHLRNPRSKFFSRSDEDYGNQTMDKLLHSTTLLMISIGKVEKTTHSYTQSKE